MRRLAGDDRVHRAMLLGPALGLFGMVTGARADTPILVGGDADFDACGASGVVHGLDPKGDDFLSVRADPASKARETDRLGAGDTVIVCNEHGNWLGIVYGDGSCGVASPIRERQPYRGKCKSGWVYGSYVRVDAG